MSNFIVSARKYRPSRFKDVVGQEHVSQTLKNALQNDHLAHAFLFCGPRGVGKTTCARILAKVLNCQNVTGDYEPCGECSSCKALNANSSFNITELDAASNNSVEHIRALIEQVRFQPQQGKYKVFIIDEVHMLSQQAFNAFLKTLEEPPPYAIFILATTEKHKIIPTILSRCQIFDFRRIQVPQMVAHLEEICEQENIEAEKDALHIIAQKADGALRDALSIFDRIVAFSGNKITYENVIDNLNVLDYDYFFQMVDALLIEDSAKVLIFFDDILRKGFDPDIFINGLAEHLRNLLVCKDEETLQLLEASDKLRGRYRQQARLAPANFLLTALNIANDCDVNYKLARNKRLHVEMALIKMAHIHRAFRLAENGAAALGANPEKKTLAPSEEAEEVKTAEPEVQVFKPDAQNEEAEEPVIPESQPTNLHTSIPKNLHTETPPHRNTSTPKHLNTEVQPQQPGAEPANFRAGTEKPSPPSSDGPVNPITPDPQPKPEPPTPQHHNTTTPNPKRLKASRKHETPKLMGLDAMLAEVRAEEAQGANHQAEELTLERAEEAWNQYIDALEQESVKAIMRNTVLKLEQGNLLATVSSSLAENTIRQENNLMEYLREVLAAPELAMSIEVDKSKVVEPPRRKRMLSSKDKYLAMRETNPLLQEMQQRFDLRPDE